MDTRTICCSLVLPSRFFFCGQVGALRVIKTADDPPKCKGLALVRYMDRESAKKALDGMPAQKVTKQPIDHLVGSWSTPTLMFTQWVIKNLKREHIPYSLNKTKS